MKIILRVLLAFALIGLGKVQIYHAPEEESFESDEKEVSQGEFPPSIDTDRDEPSARRRRSIFRGGFPYYSIKASILAPFQQSYLPPPILSPGSCACGTTNNDPTEIIKGGSEVNPPNKYPWMVALLKGGQTVCGGALITEQHILTASHCIAKDLGSPFARGTFHQPSDIEIAFVTENPAVAVGPPVMAVIPHPQFDFNTVNNDIAIIKLSRKVRCSKNIRPICLPRPQMPAPKHLTIAGWGTTSRGVAARHLREAQVQIVSFKHCNKFRHIKPNYYCLKGLKNSSPCHGDSGGPLFAERQGRFYLYGATSMHVSEVCDLNSAFVYTKVPKYLSWISSITRRS